MKTAVKHILSKILRISCGLLAIGGIITMVGAAGAADCGAITSNWLLTILTGLAMMVFAPVAERLSEVLDR